nr:MAG TPA: Kruppel-like factor 3 finger, kruppel-like, DNA BINDING [Bacteriophage sp.]
MSTKRFECDSCVSDYVFTYCRDMIDLMRRGVWVGG